MKNKARDARFSAERATARQQGASLARAALTANARAIQRLLAQGADPNWRKTPEDPTALDLAADGGHLACAKLMLPQSKPETIANALRKAAQMARVDLLRALSPHCSDKTRVLDHQNALLAGFLRYHANQPQAISFLASLPGVLTPELANEAVFMMFRSPNPERMGNLDAISGLLPEEDFLDMMRCARAAQCERFFPQGIAREEAAALRQFWPTGHETATPGSTESFSAPARKPRWL